MSIRLILGVGGKEDGGLPVDLLEWSLFRHVGGLGRTTQGNSAGVKEKLGEHKSGVGENFGRVEFVGEREDVRLVRRITVDGWRKWK